MSEWLCRNAQIEAGFVFDLGLVYLKSCNSQSSAKIKLIMFEPLVEQMLKTYFLEKENPQEDYILQNVAHCPEEEKMEPYFSYSLIKHVTHETILPEIGAFKILNKLFQDKKADSPLGLEHYELKAQTVYKETSMRKKYHEFCKKHDTYMLFHPFDQGSGPDYHFFLKKKSSAPKEYPEFRTVVIQIKDTNSNDYRTISYLKSTPNGTHQPFFDSDKVHPFRLGKNKENNENKHEESNENKHEENNENKHEENNENKSEENDASKVTRKARQMWFVKHYSNKENKEFEGFIGIMLSHDNSKIIKEVKNIAYEDNQLIDLKLPYVMATINISDLMGTDKFFTHPSPYQCLCNPSFDDKVPIVDCNK